MSWKFSTAAELLERAAEAGLSVSSWLLARDAFYSGKPEAELRSELAQRIRITRQSLDRGVREPQASYSGLTQGGAAKLAASEAWPVEDELFRRALVYALAVNEVSACGGRIVAFPTAGSSGIVPGVLWAYRDARDPALNPESARFQDAFAMASAVGMVVAKGATLSGAAGGCQAECGAAGAMAAAGLAFLFGEGDEACFGAAALSLKNSLGLACDPVAGLVEVPCVKRNAFLAANALTAVSLLRAGIRSAIPFDEVVQAMRSIGEALPASLKESSEGGLAQTPTGLAWKDRIR